MSSFFKSEIRLISCFLLIEILILSNSYKWLGEISSGISISASADASTQSAKLTYQYEYGGNTTSNYSPLNVGFGLTYVLPVIVLILKAKPGDFIIVEKPESHLHPAGEAKLAETHQHWQKLICHCLFLPTIYRYFPVVARFDFLDVLKLRCPGTCVYFLPNNVLCICN
jgi:hypothetical protein